MHFDWSKLLPREFEEMCKDLLISVGFQNVVRRSGPGQGDFGQDITAEDEVKYKSGLSERVRVLVQCKNYGSSRTAIGPQTVEQYALRAETLGYQQLLIMTSYDLTSQAKTVSYKISTDTHRRIRVIYWTESDLVTLLQDSSRTREKYFPQALTHNLISTPTFVKLGSDLYEIVETTQGIDGTPFCPLEIWHEKMESPLRIFAAIDTGYTGSLLMGDVLGRKLDSYEVMPVRTDERVLVAGAFGLATDTYELVAKLPGMNKWVRVPCHFPRGLPFAGNVVGMQLLKHAFCFVLGPDSKVLFAKKMKKRP